MKMDAAELDALNALPGWAKEMGLVITSVGDEEVVCEFDVEQKHHQGFGIVHGGVHCGVVETVASIGAMYVARERKQRVVGLENTTSFIRAVRTGRLVATATPVTRGRTTQVWSVEIVDDAKKTVAKGQVRLLCMDEERPIANG